MEIPEALESAFIDTDLDKLWKHPSRSKLKAKEAELAKEKTNGYKLDRAPVFVVSMFGEIKKFMKVPDEWPLLKSSLLLLS